MSDIAIKIENLSKAYQLGQIGTGTISRDIERWFARLRGKEDPFLSIGETNNRSMLGKSDVVWSLRDINFEIESGDAVGIIGRNGAGKSTLLKILSKITTPTTGKISGKGRVASLLEVGTGFHPELTGKENIYLNGAILGMRKKEIKRKFDEIVDFAGVARYIDTPVKRYSTGMYVRLAFAVAAHLESEILIVDEVLAVGDAEFQKKCLGKMNSISQSEGRTVLFVSHNMAAIKELCRKAVLLQNGEVDHIGSADATIQRYLKPEESTEHSRSFRMGTAIKDDVQIKDLCVNDKNTFSELQPKEPVHIELKYEVLHAIANFRLSFILHKDGERLLTIHDTEDSENIAPGSYISDIQLPEYFLRPGLYTISIGGHNSSHSSYNVGQLEWFLVQDILSFEVMPTWSIDFDFNNIGFINISNKAGSRRAIQ